MFPTRAWSARPRHSGDRRGIALGPQTIFAHRSTIVYNSGDVGKLRSALAHASFQEILVFRRVTSSFEMSARSPVHNPLQP